MQFARSLMVWGLALAGTGASATVTLNAGPYTLSYDETTPAFGSLASLSSGPGGAVSFEWSISAAVQALSAGGAPVSVSFQIPDFTITANPGYVLTGPVTRRLGNLAFAEVGVGAITSVGATGTVTVGGGTPGTPPPFLLPQVYSSNTPAQRFGYFDGTVAFPLGSFQSIDVSHATLVLSAQGGAFAAINAQPQNVLQVSFFAQAVPEPETYALFLAGLGVLGWLAKRRQG